MTEKTFKERFADWFDDQKENHGLVDFKPYFDREAIARQFGAKTVKDEFGFITHLDFSETEYKTIMHPEVQEFIYEGLYKFVTAPSVRIRHDTDYWGNMLDPDHPDYMTVEDRVKHVELCKRIDGIGSRYETALVLQGHLPPDEDMTMEDYQALWDEKLREYTERTGKEWPHPKVDPETARENMDAAPSSI